jgi:signal transduction histidine kinase
MPLLPTGGDEVGAISAAFTAMEQNLAQRAAEQTRLEREVLEVSENERQRISIELHDGVGQLLTAVSMSTSALVSAANKAGAAGLAERGEEIGRQVRDAISEVRLLARGLAPVHLAEDGLVNGLAALAESMNRSGVIKCVFENLASLPVVSPEVAGHLYRIAQEAVNNAMKHARASEIRIGLEFGQQTLSLIIDDDGEGMEPADFLGDGMGLRVMRHRADLIGASIEIMAAPAGGTRVFCQLEVPK